jgi:aryl carrier-like protein
MIPTAWVALSSMPMTPNGKIDRRALPSPATSDHSDRPTYEAPTTPFEKSLSAIWSEVLSRDAIGIHDDLFALGADSIHLFRIVARAHQEGIKLSASDLLRHRRIAELSTLMSTASETASSEAASLRSFAAQRHGRTAQPTPRQSPELVVGRAAGPQPHG